jgi:hypothetical protein
VAVVDTSAAVVDTPGWPLMAAGLAAMPAASTLSAARALVRVSRRAGLLRGSRFQVGHSRVDPPRASHSRRLRRYAREASIVRAYAFAPSGSGTTAEVLIAAARSEIRGGMRVPTIRTGGGIRIRHMTRISKTRLA